MRYTSFVLVGLLIGLSSCGRSEVASQTSSLAPDSLQASGIDMNFKHYCGVYRCRLQVNLTKLDQAKVYLRNEKTSKVVSKTIKKSGFFDITADSLYAVYREGLPGEVVVGVSYYNFGRHYDPNRTADIY